MIREDLSELESELIQDPDSYELRERLLSAYAENSNTCLDPRRIEHIRWFIRNHPGDIMCRTPFVHVYPDQLPDVYVVLKEDWRHALAARPADVDVVRAAANFMALSDREAAHQLLLDAVNRDPGNGSLRVELGRLSLRSEGTARAFSGWAEAWRRRCAEPAGLDCESCNPGRGLHHRGNDRSRTTGLGREDACKVR